MTSLNARAVRDEFVTLANAALVGAGKPTQAIKSARGEQIDAAPLLVVSVFKVRRSQYGMGAGSSTQWRTIVTLGLTLFVPGADDSPGVNRTEQIAEDQALDIEQAIADLIASNRTGTNWDYLTFANDERYGELVPMEVNKQPHFIFNMAAEARKDGA